jgi:hypothetical protein
MTAGLRERMAQSRRSSIAAAALAVAMVASSMTGCAQQGRLGNVQPASPVKSAGPRTGTPDAGREVIQMRPLFGDTAIGLVPGTGDSSRRFLGRLRDGYVADTLNIFIFGDNRPGWYASRLAPEYEKLHGFASGNPAKIFTALITVPVALFKGLWPDLALFRDVVPKIRNMPQAGAERQVMSAMLAKIDSIQAHGERVAAVINTGDLVDDGRYPAHWQRFLRLTQPLSSRVPYFAVAGNHERTDSPVGVDNWRAATGLPVGGDRLYYCFDSADGWMRFIALDTNPIVDPGSHWSRQTQVKYSEEEFRWLIARVKEHTGPVLIMMHHPPFSAGYHRMEWQADSVLSLRRLHMLQAIHESGISILASGHEHAYQRAVFTWPDGALITVVSGGGGAPLMTLPPPQQSAALFSQYHVAGSSVDPKNVYSAVVYNFTHLRVWYGGGEMYAYAVDQKSHATQIDHVVVDLKRYGVPQVDQHKIPVPVAKGPKIPPAAMEGPPSAKTDTTAASKRLLAHPPPGKKPAPRTPRK